MSPSPSTANGTPTRSYGAPTGSNSLFSPSLLVRWDAACATEWRRTGLKGLGHPRCRFIGDRRPWRAGDGGDGTWCDHMARRAWAGAGETLQAPEVSEQHREGFAAKKEGDAGARHAMCTTLSRGEQGHANCVTLWVPRWWRGCTCAIGSVGRESEGQGTRRGLNAIAAASGGEAEKKNRAGGGERLMRGALRQAQCRLVGAALLLWCWLGRASW